MSLNNRRPNYKPTFLEGKPLVLFLKYRFLSSALKLIIQLYDIRGKAEDLSGSSHHNCPAICFINNNRQEFLSKICRLQNISETSARWGRKRPTGSACPGILLEAFRVGKIAVRQNFWLMELDSIRVLYLAQKGV